MKKLIWLCTCGLFLFGPLAATSLHAAETPETILIRKSLNDDKFGRRRGDVDLVLSAYAENIVVYEGNNTIDPKGWSVLYENLPAFKASIQEDLKIHRYELERTVPFILVREKKAIVTTQDSGRVINPQTGESSLLKTESFWFFSKIEDTWKATSFVHGIGDSTTIGNVQLPSDSVPKILELFKREEQAWEDGSAGTIASLYSETFTGCDAIDKLGPASWKIIFASFEELEGWVSKRLNNTSYQIDREILYANLSKGNQEALALTRETVTTAYNSGPITHSIDRYVLWTLSREAGDWQITNMIFNFGLPK